MFPRGNRRGSTAVLISRKQEFQKRKVVQADYKPRQVTLEAVGGAVGSEAACVKIMRGLVALNKLLGALRTWGT